MKIKFLGLIMALFAFSVSAFGQTRQQPAQVINQSTRGIVGAGSEVFTLGLVVVRGDSVSPETASTNSQRFLIRAGGPVLGMAPFNLPNVASNPKITVYHRTRGIVAENDDWTGDLALYASQVGAFPFPANSKDSALLVSLTPGDYTIQVTDPTSIGKTVLVEVYTVTRDTGLLKLGNLSVLTSNTPVIVGFVTDGVGTKRFLVRAVGPSLASFGVTSVMTNPRITVFNARGQAIASNDNWTSEVGAFFASTGAFPFMAGSLDAAVVFDQPISGPVSISIAGQSATTNELVSGQRVLIEVYEIR